MCISSLEVSLTPAHVWTSIEEKVVPLLLQLLQCIQLFWLIYHQAIQLFFRSLAPLHIWFRQRTTFPTFVAHCTEKVHYGGKSLPLGTSQKVVRYVVVEAEAGLSSLLRRQCMCGYRQVNTEQAGSLLSLLGHGKGLTFQSLRSI